MIKSIEQYQPPNVQDAISAALYAQGIHLIALATLHAHNAETGRGTIDPELQFQDFLRAHLTENNDIIFDVLEETDSIINDPR